MRKAIVLGVTFLAFGPASSLLAVGVLMNPSAQASCLPGGTSGLEVEAVPDRLAATTSDGIDVRLDGRQLAHAATIIGVGGRTDEAGRDGITVALMAALTESNLLMLSNTAALPDSGAYPNDGDGGDHDSLGLFQMRPSTGWGSVAELMDPDYQARAFFGGPTGPNGGSPRGLLDIPGWQSFPKDVAAQAVEVSAYPERYERWEPVAATIIDTLTRSPGPGPSVSEAGRIVFPLSAGTWVKTSDFGIRVHPITGVRKLHTGVDYAAPSGTPILAVADGRVAFAGPVAGYGNLILIEHTVDGQSVVSGYAHMYAEGIHVQVDDIVTAGQRIADVGVTGYSTGPHLHFEIRPGGTNSAPIDPEPWLASHGAAVVGGTAAAADETGCGERPAGAPASSYAGSNPNQLVNDPTTDGQITQRTAHLLTQVRAQFRTTAWSCWSSRTGTQSEHPLGRACDGTFGNALGTAAAGDALDLGWRVTNWLQDNAETLGVEYLIWQGQIWSVARDSEGWRPYYGGGMHDANSVTGGHYDHLHFTTVA